MPDWLKPWTCETPTQTEDMPRIVCLQCGNDDVAVMRIYHSLRNQTTVYLRCKHRHDFEIALAAGVIYDLVFWR